MEEELIEAVRRETCLYDIKHPDYLKFKLKYAIWGRIAEGLSLKDGNKAKKAWEKLRNNHRDALRRQKNAKRKSGSGTVNIKSWRFQENMAFLIPYMANRSTSTNKCEETEYDEESQTNSVASENVIQENKMDREESRTDSEETKQASAPSVILTQQINELKGNKTNTLNDTLNRSIAEHAHREANSQGGRERLMADRANDFTVNNVRNDPLFHFFICMYETTKRLPPLSQYAIKTSIFSFVSKEEGKHLIEYSVCPHSGNTQKCDEASFQSECYLSRVQVEQLSENSMIAEGLQLCNQQK